MDNTRTRPSSPAEELTDHQWIDAIESLETEHDWTSYAHCRIAQAENLLTETSEVIDTLEPQSREHAADLLDTAIETLTRLTTRFPASSSTTPGQYPPF